MSPESSLKAIGNFAQKNAPELFKTAATLIIATNINHGIVMHSAEPSSVSQDQAKTEQSLPSCQEPLFDGSAERSVFIGTTKELGIACDDDIKPSHQAPSGTIFPQSDLMV